MQFFERILNLNLKDYGGGNLPIGLILLCIFVGMIAATVVIQYSNAVVRRAVKALVRHKCGDAESAKTLEKLGLDADKGVLRALRRKNPMLMRLLEIVEDEAAAKAKTPPAEATNAVEDEKTAPKRKKKVVPQEPSFNLQTARFFLKPETQDQAKEILSRGDASVMHTVLYCGVLVALYFAIALTLPYVLSLIF